MFREAKAIMILWRSPGEAKRSKTGTDPASADFMQSINSEKPSSENISDHGQGKRRLKGIGL